MAVLVDDARLHLPETDFKALVGCRTAKGYTATQLARRQGHAKIAAFLEWNVAEPGTGSHADASKPPAWASKPKGSRGVGFVTASTTGLCGLQVCSV